MVMNIVVAAMSVTSVNVSWDRLDFSGLTGYIVYYTQTGNSANEQSVYLTNSTNTVVIGDLRNNVEYLFQVAAIAVLDGVVTIGERSTLNSIFIAVRTSTTDSTMPMLTPAQGTVSVGYLSKSKSS